MEAAHEQTYLLLGQIQIEIDVDNPEYVRSLLGGQQLNFYHVTAGENG